MSGADLLRRAAEALRSHAQAATAGPWNADPAEIYGDTIATWVAESLNGSLPDAGAANSRFIALMHPGVALALADLLDREAETIANAVDAWNRDPSYINEKLGGVEAHTEHMFEEVLALSREILRERR